MRQRAGAERAVVLVSGGIDSAVALYWALDAGLVPVLLSFDYPERPPREREATRALAVAVGAPPLFVDLPWMREAVDLPPALRARTHLARAPEGYVPSRNLVYYAVAWHFAEVQGASVVVGGHTRPDADTFPDASPEFLARFAATANAGLPAGAPRPVRVELPLAKLDKRGVLELGARLGVPFAVTWSCYWHDRPSPCGSCASCTERADAFASVGEPDPLLA